MRIVSDAPGLAAFHDGTFVPTMGALHEGHLSLIRTAAACARPVVVSIFVNPTQFAPGEDFTRYPRPLEADLAACEQSGADVAFTPSPEVIYPRPPAGPIPVPPLPEVATRPRLEDAHRPDHFAGVCQVVARLFDLVRPAAAIFGEKDYQQLLVVEALVRREGGRWPGLRIIRGQTMRDPDGLALSSRNVYLAPGERDRALALFRALDTARHSGRATPAERERLMSDLLDAHDLAVDYAVIRDAETLLPVGSFDRPTRGLIAARLDRIRLIDNMPMPLTT